MLEYIIGIDIGTGSTKCVAMDLKGAVIGTSQQHYTISHPEHGYSEQDPELIWQAFVKCFKDLLTRLKEDPLTISLSTAMHSVIPTDENGMALSNMITWADIRSESIATNLKNSAEGETFYRLTGTPIHPMSPLCKLIWLRENKAALFNNTSRFISIKEYIWYKLFHEFQIDYSIASATGLFDIKKLKWNEEVCSYAGIDRQKLSTPVNTSYSRKDLSPHITTLLGLKTNVPFVIGASDGCCANLGSFTTKPGTAALTIGTSGAVRITGTDPVYNYSAMIFNYLLDEQTFVSGGAVNNGGNAVNWLLENFLNKSPVSPQDYVNLFNTIETVPAGSKGLLFLPYLYGERAPIWNAKSSGAFLNIRPEHDQSHFSRAVLEGICYALNDVLKTLEQSSPPIERINVSGGFISSPTWLQMLADITGKNLYVLQLEDASAIGAIYMALKALFPDVAYSTPDQNNTLIIKPNIQNHELYAKSFIIYKKVVQNMKESMDLFTSLT
ncbi:Gluconokinase [Arcticibacter svalbardensis MN12-7]|uniref:Gluconokinase n=1 Tax=Arcticibacter svalbardensis MN12-7 TaxID=1150600 RepID=R9GUY9_9SPHI|nr:gluconokinase [Arcticibacter svalbardensis]EOR95508.1 Gluconokinase [Arcticibacter svalbardensis MN12-7]